MPQSRAAGSSRTLLAVLFVASLATKSCQNFLLPDFNEDKVYQAAAGQSWRDGHGFTVPVLRPSGFDRVPFVGFPPGYSLLYAAAIGPGRTPFGAGFLIDTLAAAIFFAAWYALLVTLTPGIGAAAGLSIGLYWAIAFSPLATLQSSDGLSLALFSASVAMIIRTIHARHPFVWSVAAGVAAGAAAGIRFAYWPLVAVPVLLVPLVPRAGKLARMAACAAPSFGIVLWAALVNLQASGTLTTVLKTSRGLYWRNILDTTPFAAEIFGFETAWDRLAVSIPAAAPLVPLALWAVTVFVFVVGVAGAIRDLRTSDDPAVRVFSAATLLTVIVTSAVIAGLGLITPKAENGWTLYREASRYMGPVFPFFTVAVFRAVSDRRRAVALAAVALLAVGGASVVAYRAGQLRMTLTKNREAHPSGPRTRAWLASLHRVLRDDLASGRAVLYCDPDLTREYFAVMSGAVAPRGGCGAEEQQSAIAAGGVVRRPADVPGSLPTTPAPAAPR